jgi:hypothetical protein
MLSYQANLSGSVWIRFKVTLRTDSLFGEPVPIYSGGIKGGRLTY